MKVGLQLPWNPNQVESFLSTAREADEAGVHSLWVNEGFGHDAFSGLALLARKTSRVKLGTAIVNVFSRTPGALAQHFATIDQLSGGRVIVGLGASAAGAVERFHGVPFERPLVRLAETAKLLRMYWARERFSFEGDLIRVDRALTMGVEPVQPQPPVVFATMAPAAVRVTANVADGWLPAYIPIERLADEIAALRAKADGAGRDGTALLVRSPGTAVVVADSAAIPDVRRRRAEQIAYFAARNGEFYYRQFVRQGLGAEANAIRAAWGDGGPGAAAAVAGPLVDRLDCVGDVDACLAHLREQASRGVDVQMVAFAGGDAAERARALRTLTG